MPHYTARIRTNSLKTIKPFQFSANVRDPTLILSITTLFLKFEILFLATFNQEDKPQTVLTDH